MAIVLLLALSQIVLGQYQWTEKYYQSMPIDHFSFADNRTFALRYFVNDTWYQPGGPVLFYCGNEGSLEVFTQNTGLMWDWAPEMHALLVFGEHRYYGKTMPFGDASFKSLNNLGYLSSEQALGDFAELLTSLKKDLKLTGPIIAVGGSYGGMLAAWMRMKYPHIIDGALAGSAPILQFTGLTPCWKYGEIVTRTFDHDGAVVGNVHCTNAVRVAWPAIRRLSKSDTGLQKLNQIFRLCNDSTLKKTSDVDDLISWIAEQLNNLPMIDYPYESDFISNVPAWPVREACKRLKKVDAPDSMLAMQLHDAIGVIQNYTGSTTCYSLSPGAGSKLGDAGWDFQACTEMVMPMCSNGTDMFEKADWNINYFAQKCAKNWFGAATRENWAVTQYGGNKLRAVSNIIFSNGDLDPWSGGGVSEHPFMARNIHIIRITEGAHHYDLRADHANDTAEIRQVRAIEKSIVKQWIDIASSLAS